MLKRIFSITIRDFKSNVREFILLYILVAPFLLAVGLNAFIPSVEATAIQFAVDETVEVEFVDFLQTYGSVEQVKSRNDLENRLESIDEVIGISKNEDQFEIVLYGDEREGAGAIASKIIQTYKYDKSPVAYKFTSLGVEDSPIALIGTISLIIMALALGGGIIGLNIIEEKEDGTVRAIVVSPVTRSEFITGKSITGAATALIQTFGILMIVGYAHVNLLQVLFLTGVSLSILVLFGFLIGIFSSNQVVGLTNLKFLFLPISISIIGAVAMPSNWHFTLYWSPFYWSYLGYSEILSGSASWSNLALYSGAILSGFIIVLGFTRKRIVNGLS